MQTVLVTVVRMGQTVKEPFPIDEKMQQLLDAAYAVWNAVEHVDGLTRPIYQRMHDAAGEVFTQFDGER